MAIRKITFTDSNVTAQNDADLYYFLEGGVGILAGIKDEAVASNTLNRFTFGAGYVAVYGRLISVDAGTDITVPLDRTAKGYVVVDVNTSTGLVELTYIESTAGGYPTLATDDLSKGAGHYQFVLAGYSKNSAGLTKDETIKPKMIYPKINIPQGAEHAGKVLVIGASGQVELKNQSSIDAGKLGGHAPSYYQAAEAGKGLSTNDLTDELVGTIGSALQPGDVPNFDTFSESKKGLAPAASGTNKKTAETAVGNYYLCADGYFRQLPANAFKNDNTTYNVTSKGVAGLCPALPDEVLTTKYLKADGTWATPPNTETIYATLAYCETNAATNDKVATLRNYARLYGKNRILIYFKYGGNTTGTSLTLNINNTGAADIRIGTKAGVEANKALQAGLYSAYFVLNSSTDFYYQLELLYAETFSTTANGLVPMNSTAKQAAATGSSSAPMRVLASDGYWRLLPANAYNNTTYSDATTGASGLMSAGDKTKLNGLSSAANAFAEAERLKTLNLFDGTYTRGIILNGNGIESGNIEYKTTGFIKLPSSGSYYLNSGYTYLTACLYNSNKSFNKLLTQSAISGDGFSAEAGQYVRFSVGINQPNVMLSFSEGPMSYQPYNGPVAHRKDVMGDLLWQNGNPYTNLSGGNYTVLDWTGYKYIYILWKEAIGADSLRHIEKVETFAGAYATLFYLAQNTSATYLINRSVTLSNATTIAISYCYVNNVVETGNIIITEIYGSNA